MQNNITSVVLGNPFVPIVWPFISFIQHYQKYVNMKLLDKLCPDH